MPRKPRHSPQGDRPAAERQFVDREEFIAPVRTALKEPLRTKPLVLVYYGGAGIGKSRLRRELVSQLTADPAVVTATLDFAIPVYRQPDTALLALRRSILSGATTGRESGDSPRFRGHVPAAFPSFDIAYAVLWQKSHPDAPLGDDLKPLLEPGSLLLQLLDDSGKLPLIGLIPRISKLFAASLDPSTTRPLDHSLRTWWSQRGERELEDLPQMEPAAIVEQLPKLWAADLKDHLGATGHKPQASSKEPGLSGDTIPNRGDSGHVPSRRAVLFIDAYEQLWETGASEADFSRRDEWVRELVTQLPEVLWVICGRQKLRWEEVDKEWSASLSQHQLEALPDKSARRFLESCGITNEPIQDAIVKGSQGVPHYLDLAVDTVERTRDEGRGTKLTGDNPDELVKQFVRHLDQPEIDALQVLSGPRFWYYGLFENLMSEYQTGFPLTAYDDLSRFSFVSEGAAPGTRTMHELMREALQESQSPELRKRVHLFLHELYAKQLERLDVKSITEKHSAALIEAFYHGRQAKSAAELWPWLEAAADIFVVSPAQYRLLLPLFREMVRALEAELGPNHVVVAESLDWLARLLRLQEDFAEAEPLFRRALAVRENVLGSGHPEVANSLRNLGLLLERQGKYAESEPLCRRALVICEKALGTEHPETGESLIRLAGLLFAQGKYAESEPLCRRALAIAEKAFGPEHFVAGERVHSLAVTLHYQDRRAEAEPLYRRSLAIREKTFGPEHPNVAISLNQLAGLLARSQGKCAEAEPLLRRARAIMEKALGPDSSWVHVILDSLASLLLQQGRYTEAEPLYRRALAIVEKARGPEHPEVSVVMGNLAELLHAEGRNAEAEALARRSLAIREKTLSPDHPTLPYSLDIISRLLMVQRRYAEAEPLARRALTIREKALGPEHSDVAYSLDTLSTLLSEQGRYTEAEPLARRSLAIREKAHGPEHPEVADSLHALAGPLMKQNKHAEAEPLARRALAIRELKLGPDHPDVAKTLDVLAKVCEQTGRAAEAQELAERAKRIRAQTQTPPNNPQQQT